MLFSKLATVKKGFVIDMVGLSVFRENEDRFFSVDSTQVSGC